MYAGILSQKVPAEPSPWKSQCTDGTSTALLAGRCCLCIGSNDVNTCIAVTCLTFCTLSSVTRSWVVRVARLQPVAKESNSQLLMTTVLLRCCLLLCNSGSKISSNVIKRVGSGPQNSRRPSQRIPISRTLCNNLKCKPLHKVQAWRPSFCIFCSSVSK